MDTGDLLTPVTVSYSQVVDEMNFDQIYSPPGIFLIFSYRAAAVDPRWVPVAIHAAWGDVVQVVRTLTGWLSEGHIHCNFDMYAIFRVLRLLWIKHSVSGQLTIVLQLGLVILSDHQDSFTSEVVTAVLVILSCSMSCLYITECLSIESFICVTSTHLFYVNLIFDCPDRLYFLWLDAGGWHPYPPKFPSLARRQLYNYTSGSEATLNIWIFSLISETVKAERRIANHVYIICDILSLSLWVSPLIATPGHLFTRQPDISPQDLVKSRSHKNWVYTFQSLWNCCQIACQIWKRYDHFNTQSRSFEISRDFLDLTVYRITT